jgi:hypothetical protein
MGRCLTAILLTLLLFQAAAGADTGKTLQLDPDPSAWLADYAQARQLARAAGKPLLVVFRCPH